jgi:hypothetical protein
MKVLKELLKVKKNLAEKALYKQDEIQDVLTEEIKMNAEELKGAILEEVKKVSSLEEIDSIKKNFKQILKIVKEAEELDEDMKN